MKALASMLLSLALLLPDMAAAAPDVVVSIKPIHSLAATLMDGVGEPKLIVTGTASPHGFALRPSHAAALQGADIVFRVGAGLETFLDGPLAALAASAEVVTLADSAGLTRLPLRRGGRFEADDHHDHAHHDHAEGAFDTHLWLDPKNAKIMAAAMEQALVAADPDNAARYRANAKELSERLDGLDTELQTLLEPVKNRPFIVFHDAYQYFEHRYGLNAAGSITVSPDIAPGAERLRSIRARLGETGAFCVFAEPQFEPKLVRIVTEGTQVRFGLLDPEATALAPGKNLYFDLMRALARSVRECLSRPA